MRKVVVEFDLVTLKKFGVENLFRTVEYIETRQFLRLDFEKGIKLLINDIKMKPGYKLDDIEFPEGVEILDVLREDGNCYTCLIKSSADKIMRKLMGLPWDKVKDLPPLSEARKLFGTKLNIIPDPPIYISEEKVVFGFLGDKRSIELMLKVLRFFGEVKRIYFPRTGLVEYTILSYLTEKQKEAMTVANKFGYYEYPRKISSEKLAEKLGLTKTTLIEHLRKAENRLISNILA